MIMWHHIDWIAWELAGLRRDIAAAPESRATIEWAMQDMQARYAAVGK